MFKKSMPKSNRSANAPLTTKEKARAKSHNGGHVFVGSAAHVDRSNYEPHQGVREMQRRLRKMKVQDGNA